MSAFIVLKVRDWYWIIGVFRAKSRILAIEAATQTLPNSEPIPEVVVNNSSVPQAESQESFDRASWILEKNTEYLRNGVFDRSDILHTIQCVKNGALDVADKDALIAALSGLISSGNN